MRAYETPNFNVRTVSKGQGLDPWQASRPRVIIPEASEADGLVNELNDNEFAAVFLAGFQEMASTPSGRLQS